MSEEWEGAEQKKITPEQARTILAENGLEVSLEEAEEILGWLRKLAFLTLSEILKK